MSLTAEESEHIFALAEKLIGSCQEGRYRREIIVANVERRMHARKIERLDRYLALTKSEPAEEKELFSALTIHTTSWFRESPHFDQLHTQIKIFHERKSGKPFRFWSSACSTGEEVYTAGLVLESFRRQVQGFDYELLGTDIDPVSVQHAKRAIYLAISRDQIPDRYHGLLWVGTGKTEGLLTLDVEIRKRARFEVASLMTIPEGMSSNKWDWIFCRNVLIYFEMNRVVELIAKLSRHVSPQGVLCLGHCEVLERYPSGFVSITTACYQNTEGQTLKNRRQKENTQVLVVDDSKVVRKVLVGLVERAGFKAIEAESAEVASQKIKEERFELVTLDLNMPGQDGLSWLRQVRSKGFMPPVIIISDSDPKDAEKTFGALESGAQDHLVKSVLNKTPEDVLDRFKALVDAGREIAHGIKTARPNLTIKSKENALKLETFIPEVILIGASTGGPDALWTMLREMPGLECPPIVIVQHINGNFALPFAQRLSSISKIPLGGSKMGVPLESGKLYLADESYHIGVERKGDQLYLLTSNEEKIHGHRPAVDFLFMSAARAKVRALCFLMTGLGRDGARGMRELYDTGLSYTVAQSAESCVVNGMPNEAVKLGAVYATGNIKEMRSWIDQAITNRKAPFRQKVA